MKTNELTGIALAYAVCEATAEWEFVCVTEGVVRAWCPVTEWGDRQVVDFEPHQNWAQGGPIIERESIALRRWLECGWQADKWNFKFAEGHSQGKTALIAAMRCYVVSKLGDEVDIPEELK